MKYLKIYEEYRSDKFFIDKRTINDLIDEGFLIDMSISMLSLTNRILTSLEGIEKFPNLTILYIRDNYLTNLDELKNIPTLKQVYSDGNPFELPIPVEITDRFGANNIYDNDNLDKFSKYEFQKEFLTKYPDRVKDLEYIGINDKIKKEFPALIRGSEWGFFDLEGGSV